MYRSNGRTRRAPRRGQILVIAVLLMMVILLTGILFVAIVTYNQQQSSRGADVNLAQSLAEAGISWCNQNLNESPMGADWRPPFRPLVTASYVSTDPNTWPVPPVMDTAGTDYGTYGLDATADTEDDYYSDFERAHNWHGLIDATTGEYVRFGFTRIPDVNSTPAGLSLPTEAATLGGQGHILVRVTYDPDPPYELPDSDPYRAPDEMSAALKIESIGVMYENSPVYRYLVAYKPLSLTDYLLFVTDSGDTGQPAVLGFNPRVDMDRDGWDATDWLGQYFFGPMRFNSTLQLEGGNLNGTVNGSGSWLTLTPQPTSATSEVPGVNPMGITGGYLRSDRILAADGITEPEAQYTTAVRARNVDGTYTTPSQVLPSSHPSFNTYGGLILDGSNSTDGAGNPRYTEALKAPTVFGPVGGDQSRAEAYRKLTRDSGRIVTLASGDTVNLGNYGFGRGIYVDNKDDVQFVDRRGARDYDALMGEWMQVFADRYSAENSGWDPTYTTYTAPGVEVTLYPSENAALEFGGLSATNAPPTNQATVWWPYHTPGEPGIRLTRSDRTWWYSDAPNNRIIDSGEYSVYVDYPSYPNQLIFAEGNVRIHGVLPPRNANVNNPRDYNLTVLSGGTIYIDGQLLGPQDVLGRDVGSGVPPAPGSPVPDEFNTKIALIARDCVCLNATRIAPQLTSGEVSVVPDDPFNPAYDQQHWEMTPEVQGAAYMRWTLGEPLLAGNTVRVSAIHSAGDPGPAAISMNVFNSTNWSGFLFGGVLDPRKFYFLQPGLYAGANVEETLAPDWSQPWSAANPTMPWDITGALGALAPGQLKAVALSAADPSDAGLGAGSTEYRLKNWKVVEQTAGGEPTGAIHAKVNATIFAENGCWFVIPGRYFDTRHVGNAARAFLRYNYDICVRGCITEAFHAGPDMVREWSDKWAWPVIGAGWSTIRYEFDESIRNTRDPRALRLTTLNADTRYADAGSPYMLATATVQGNLPVLPCLPVSDELVFYGEGQ